MLDAAIYACKVLLVADLTLLAIVIGALGAMKSRWKEESDG